MPYLHPTADLAERVILVDDPGRALALAQVLCDPTPLMFNHARGLWGYSGAGLDGAPVTLQAIGIGGPSAALVVGELAALGAQRFVLVGSAAGVGGVLVVEAAIAADGTSRALGASERVAPDAGLLGALRGVGLAVGVVESRDVPGEGGVFDLETAAVLQAAARLGRPAAAVLVGEGADDDTVAAAGRAALTALG